MERLNPLELIPEMEARLARNADDAEAYFYLGYAHECFTQNEARARECYLNHFLRCIGHNDAPEAVAALERKIAAGGHEPIVHVHLAQLYAYLDRRGDAEREWSRGTVWTTTESNRFALHAVRGSVAFHDMQDIVESRERDLSKIERTFGVTWNGKIAYRFYESTMHKGAVTGDEMPAHADIENAEIHAVYSFKLKVDSPHEDTHVVLGALGRPPKLIEEGAAEYACHGDRVHERFLQTAGRAGSASVSALIDDDAFATSDYFLSYPTAGSFVGFLFERYGAVAFSKLYRSAGAVDDVYGKTLGELEKDWRGRLQQMDGGGTQETP